MTTLFLLGVTTSGLALLVSLALAAGLAWRRGHYESWIVSGTDLWLIQIVTVAVRLWPVASVLAGLAIGRFYPLHGQLTLTLIATVIALITPVMTRLVRLVQERRRMKQDDQVSQTLRKTLLPAIISKLREMDPSVTESAIEVRAFITRNGPQGAVIVRISPSRSSRDAVRSMLRSVVPGYLKLNVEVDRRPV